MASEIPSFSHPVTTERVLALLDGEGAGQRRYLDLGAGAGYLSWKLYEWLERRGVDPAERITPCDLHPELFQFSRLRCIEADFGGRLPFGDASFDAVICMEVVEHVPDQLHLFGEMARVVKPGGRAIVTTPNVLNVNSRIRYLLNGTMPLFDIMPIAESDVVHTTGHINPVSLYYLYYFARRAGFREIRFHIDRVKRSATLLAPLLWGAGRLADLASNARRRRLPWFPENREAVRAVNRWSTLVGRTIILDAVR